VNRASTTSSFLLLRDQDVDVELGPKARDALHKFERGHLQFFLPAVVLSFASE
jgi:hypothetical protein